MPLKINYQGMHNVHCTCAFIILTRRWMWSQLPSFQNLSLPQQRGHIVVQMPLVHVNERRVNESPIIGFVPHVIHGNANVLQSRLRQKWREEFQENGDDESDESESERRDRAGSKKLPPEKWKSDDATSTRARASSPTHHKVNERMKRWRHFFFFLRDENVPRKS